MAGQASWLGSPRRLGARGAAPARAVGRQLEAESLPDWIDRLFRAAYALSGSREDAEDLVQETCLRVLRRPRLVRRESDGAYLMRALRNTWVDMRRSRWNRIERAPAEELDFVAAPGTDPTTIADARAAYEAVTQLSPPLRSTIVAVDVLGLSYKEAARALGTPEGTIMSRLYRARQRVAANLGDLE
jgi:RNA polymerase sigma-70 factor (ECF subfamily)